MSPCQAAGHGWKAASYRVGVLADPSDADCVSKRPWLGAWQQGAALKDGAAVQVETRAFRSSSTDGVYISQQWEQSFRARRWAITAETAAPVRKGSTPISFRRVSTCGASFVCSVESTR